MVFGDFSSPHNTVVDVHVHNGLGGPIREKTHSLSTVVEPIDYGRPLIISIDPSKTNFAIIIGDTAGRILEVHEVKGGGKKVPLDHFTVILIDYLSKVFAKSNILVIGQEKVIMTKHYVSMVTLNEIRTVVNKFGQSIGVKVEEVNNFAWKSAVVPAQYRKGKDKWSKKFISDVFPQLSHLSHDVTDAICIFIYVRNQYLKTHKIYCDTKEDGNFIVILFDRSLYPMKDIEEFEYNSRFTFNDNASYFVNRRSNDGITKIPPSLITIELLHQASDCLLTRNTHRNDIYALVRGI